VRHVLSIYTRSANDFGHHHRHNADLEEKPARDRRSPGSDHRITALRSPTEIRCLLSCGAWYLSAAFFGGAYLSAAVIDFSAARKRIWPNAGSRYQRCSSSPC
jgi:hypothetical protein